eukprot:g5762.t1
MDDGGEFEMASPYIEWPRRSIVRNTLQNIFSSDLCEEILPIALLLSHHPRLGGSKKPHSHPPLPVGAERDGDVWHRSPGWRWLVKRLGASSIERLLTSSRSIQDQLKALLTGSETGVYSSNARTRCGALATLRSLLVSPGGEHLENAAASILTTTLVNAEGVLSDVEALPPREAQLYSSDDAKRADLLSQLAELEAEDEKKADSAAQKLSKDDAWAKKIKDEVEIKKAREMGELTPEERKRRERIIKISKEHRDLTARIRVLHMNVSRSADVIETIARQGRDLTCATMANISKCALRMMKSQIRQIEVIGKRLIAILATAVGEVRCADLAAASHFVARFEEDSNFARKSKKSLDTLLCDLLPKLAVSSRDSKQKLSSAAFHLWFPLLRYVLSRPGPVPHRALAPALTILAVHAVMPVDAAPHGEWRILRHSMLTAVLQTVKVAPKAKPAPGRVLAALCAGPQPTAREMSPLFTSYGIDSPIAAVRGACLGAFAVFARSVQTNKNFNSFQSVPGLAPALWISKYDEDESNTKLGNALWQAFRGTPDRGLLHTLRRKITQTNENLTLREAASRALAGALRILKDQVTDAVTGLMESYDTSLSKRVMKKTGFEQERGMMEFLGKHKLKVGKKEEGEFVDDDWRARLGVALALSSCAAAEVVTDDIKKVFTFVVNKGLRDPHEVVRQAMQDAGVAFVSGSFGSKNVEMLMSQVEGPLHDGIESERILAKRRETEDGNLHLTEAESKALQVADTQRTGVVMLMGALCKHLPLEINGEPNPKQFEIVQLFIQTLRQECQPLQLAVQRELPALMKAPSAKKQTEHIIATILEAVFEGKPATFGNRRGAAYGLAGVVKGAGIRCLKQYEIVSRLETAVAGKQWEARQGALFAFESLCGSLGMLFEPYVITLLPLLLTAFSDRSTIVQDAANNAAKVMMSNLTQHGMKLVMPKILPSLEKDGKWKTKQAAILLLASMAHCAPKQLSQCLPRIVPHLMEGFSDTHKKIQAAAKRALDNIGEVIKNPELQQIVPCLVAALTEPVECTRAALESLMETSFVHSIDPASLALIIPILERGLKGKKGDDKKMAALICGSITRLVSEPKDVEPYLPLLLPRLKDVIVDPIPDVRGVAAKSISTLVDSMTLEMFPQLVPWLKETLQTGASTVERSGAAQSLAAILSVLDESAREEILGDLFSIGTHASSLAREGVLWVLAFLPTALGVSRFPQYLEDVLTRIIAGLSDDSDGVRDVAMRGGQVLVTQHAGTHPEKIIPVLLDGLMDEDWRIRQSSVQLLGDLLYKLGDCQAVHVDDADEDSAYGNSKIGAEIIRKLGLETRNSVLSSLYISRSDSAVVVRQAAGVVWKSVVANTGSTLREIISSLMTKVLDILSGDSEDQHETAASSLGEIVSKMGLRVLPKILPFLESALTVECPAVRRGSCVALGEVFNASTKRQLEDYIPSLLPAVQGALCDEDEDVRTSAAKTFNKLQKTVGSESIDEIVPSLLKKLESEDMVEVERAQSGLEGILRLRSRELLPTLIPKVVGTGERLQKYQVRAIKAIALSGGKRLPFHLKTLLPSLLDHLSLENEDDEVEEVGELLVTAIDEDGLRFLIAEFTRALTKDKRTRKSVEYRTATVRLLAKFCARSETEFSEFLSLLLKECLSLYSEQDENLLAASRDCFAAIEKKFGKEVMANQADFLRQIVASTASKAKHIKGRGKEEYLLPGFNQTKGVASFLGFLPHGLLRGSPSIREHCAHLFKLVISLTDIAHLRLYLVKLAGPLIRSIGSVETKIKLPILDSLGGLIEKGGKFLKPFHPQLANSFVKQIVDGDERVREAASSSIHSLVLVTTRIDNLVKDLGNTLNSSEEMYAQLSLMKVLVSLLEVRGGDLSPKTIGMACENVEPHLSGDGELQELVSRAMGLLKSLLKDNEE